VGSAAATAADADYFEQNYVDYVAENPERKLAFYLDAVRRHAPGSAIFEIGVGKGLFVGYAARAGCEIRGCDVNAAGVEEARRRTPGADVRLGPFEDVGCESCETVVAFDVVEHIADVRGLFAAIFARLRPGGVFCFVCPVTDGPLGLVCRILDSDPTHVHMTSRAAWLRLARSTGFTIVEWTGLLRYLLPGRHYLHVELRGAARNLSPAIMVVCRKDGPRAPAGAPS
jgi:SAM-dependent methyltransferase